MQTLLLLLAFVATNISLAQLPAKTGGATILIQGTVIDSTNQSPLGYVTVVVQESKEKKVIKTTLSQNDGSFVIPGIPYGIPCQLILTYIGYKTKTITFPIISSSSINFGTIALSPTATELEEVQVITLRPLVEHDHDKTTYNVDSDPERYLLNTLDMLRKVPFITLDAEDNLHLNGSGNYQILVNGKRSSLFAGNPNEVFKALPASAIKKVEVVTNPSSKYDASGVGGIINIITHKKSISGYNGSVNLSAESPYGYNAGSFLSATGGKFSVSGRYSHRYSESPTNRGSFFRNDLVNRNRLIQTSERNGKSRSQNVSGELSFELGPQDVVTASYSLYNSSNTSGFMQLVEQRNAENNLTESYLNLNHGKGEGTGRDISLNYEHSFKKNDQQLLSVSFNSTNSGSSNTSDFILQPLLNFTSRQSTTNNQDVTREQNVQADYVQPFGKQKLELGVKSIFEKSSSNYYFKTRDEETGAYLPDPNMSNSFDYNQDIHAAYISLDLSMGKWGLRTGARLEQTELDATFRSTGTGVSREYLHLFPNVSLSRALNESGRINVSYSQRISRPGLYFLDPYVDQTDPLNISYGNPDLEPATSHTFQLEYSTFHKSTSFNANANHTFTNNAIEQATTLGKDSVARSTFRNIGQNRNYGLTLSGNTTLFKRLTLNLNTGTNYISYTSILEGKPQTNEGFTYNLRGSANLRFGKTWRFNGNLSYNSPNILLQGNTSGYTWSSLSLYKQFLKDGKASVSFSVRSPFQEKRRYHAELVNPAFYQLRESYTIIRQYSVAFNYRFGKLR